MKWAMQKPLILFLSTCTYLCFLGLIWLSKNPICIDSNVVNKIDRVFVVDGKSQSETAFSCQQKQTTKYSASLEETVDQVALTFDKTLMLLESIRPFQNKIQVIINDERPLQYQVEVGKIHLGRQFLDLNYHASRALIKAWVLENKNPHVNSGSADQGLFEESLTDFVLYVLVGRLELEDPVDRTRTKLGAVRWPHVIKNVKNYCLSAWKYAEHIEGCKTEFKDLDRLQNQQATIYSLRPLLTSALVASYNDMGWQQKGKLVSKLPYLIKQAYMALEKTVESSAANSNPLRVGISSINTFSDLIKSAVTENPSQINLLYSGVMHNLQNYGVSDLVAQAYFDYLVRYDGDVDTSSVFYKNLEKAAVKNPQVQVALMDHQSIWLLPSKTALPLDVFDQIRSRQILYINCERGIRKNLGTFFKKTEKLMLIKDCNQTVVYNFDSLFQSGIKSFITANSKVSFVQLHMASLEMVQGTLSPAQNFFELLQNHDIERAEFKSLGWSAVQWKKDLQAYRPEAVVEAIEYFRN